MSLHTLILAAGQGRRFGSTVKQLALVGQQTMLGFCVDKACVVTPGKVLVVLGYEHSRISPLLEGVQIEINSHWSRGVGSSIACGVAALPSTAEAVLIVLCDQVALTRDDFMLLTNRYRQLLDGVKDSSQVPVVCAAYAGVSGVPAIFPRRFFPQLMALEGDRGAQNIIVEAGAEQLQMGRAAIDIDTQEDWVRFNSDQQR